MKFTPIDPARVFSVGRGGRIQLKDTARITLEPDEQVTFVTRAGAEYDVVRKSWGYYATPSLNGRLRRFGLRAVLSRSPDGKFFIFLVAEGKEEELRQYMAAESIVVVRWLDDSAELEALLDSRSPGEETPDSVVPRCLCDGMRFAEVFVYDAPPAGEVRFRFSEQQSYQRRVLRCERCGHFLSVHAMDAGALYTGEYVDSTYGEVGLRRAFDRINALSPDQSDNVGRVRRVQEFTTAHFGAGRNGPGTVLDVGSGLCVFLHRMKQAGWQCTALDPDPRAAKHAREVVGVSAICSGFMEAPRAAELGRYELVTFNKVLEHVKDPASMLARAGEYLAPGGFVYVEVPDGEAAVAEGPGREEFFIDHHHVFSAESLTHLITRAGFRAKLVERLREPSTKFTLRAFLVAA